ATLSTVVHIYSFVYHQHFFVSIFLYLHLLFSLFFFFNDTAPTEIYTLSLHDALPIFVDRVGRRPERLVRPAIERHRRAMAGRTRDRKSTRLNSSHEWISYAVFCLKKKKKKKKERQSTDDKHKKSSSQRRH